MRWRGPCQQAPRLRLAVLLVALVGALWALATPLGGVPDEPAHVLYSAAVVRGQTGGGASGSDVEVPAGVARVAQASCYAFRPAVTADCIADVTGEPSPTATVTSAARYPPLYYALVGWPTLLGFGETTWYLMRLLSVLLGAGLLLAGATAWRRDTAVLPVGVLLAVTPMASFMQGAVNPNGVEILAGVALVVGGTGVLDEARAGGGLHLPRVLVALVLPAAYLCLARPGSFVLAVVLLGVLTVMALGQARSLVRSGRVLAVAGGCALAAVPVAYVQSLLLRPVGAESATGSPLVASLAVVLAQLVGRTLETVGYLGWRDHAPPYALQLTWLALTSALLLAAWFVGRPIERCALLLLAVAGAVVVPAALVLTVFPGAVGYQARYAMAVLQPLPVLAAAVLAGTVARPDAVALRVCAAVPVGTLALGLLALGGSVLRYAVGLPLPYDPLRVLAGWAWTPPPWPLLLVLLPAAGLVAWRLRTAVLADEPLPAPSMGR